MKQLIKNTINLIVGTVITLSEGYFCLFLLGAVINLLNDSSILTLSLWMLAILIISNKIKDSIE